MNSHSPHMHLDDMHLGPLYDEEQATFDDGYGGKMKMKEDKELVLDDDEVLDHDEALDHDEVLEHQIDKEKAEKVIKDSGIRNDRRRRAGQFFEGWGR